MKSGTQSSKVSLVMAGGSCLDGGDLRGRKTRLRPRGRRGRCRQTQTAPVEHNLFTLIH